MNHAAPEEYKDSIPKLSKDEKDSPTSLVIQFQPFRKILKLNEPKSSHNITKTFLAMTVLSFIQNGFIQVLHELSQEKEDNVGKDGRAAQLLQVLLVLSDRLLSPRLCLDMNNQFDLTYSQEMKNSEYFSGIQDNTNRTLFMLTKFYQQTSTIFKQRNILKSKLENVRTKVDTNMDDLHFQALIKESGIPSSKDYRKWSWEVINTLIYGPLRVPYRMNETIKSSKFLKRTFYFFNPKKKAFSEMEYKEEGIMYSNLCCKLMEILLSSSDGINLLKSSEFLKELKEILDIELSPNPESYSQRVLSEKNVKSKLCREYFTIIGKISSIPIGVKMLEEFGIFQSLLQIVKESKREEMTQLIIQNIDYSHSNDKL